MPSGMYWGKKREKPKEMTKQIYKKVLDDFDMALFQSLSQWLAGIRHFPLFPQWMRWHRSG